MSDQDRRLPARLYAAIVTPFHADETINHDALAALVDHILSQGITGIYAGGSTAEAFLLSDAERVATFRTIAEVARGRATLVAQVGTIALSAAQAMAREAAAQGFDAISSVAPFYYGFSFAEIRGYYRALVATTDLPMIVYNAPAMTGVRFTLDQLCELLDLPGVIGLKHTDNNYYVAEQIGRLRPKTLVFNGYDETILAGMALGAYGGIGTTYNVQGWRFARLLKLVAEGDIAGARQVQAKINEMIDAMIRHGVFQSTKYVLTLQGIAAGTCRAPFAPLTAAAKAMLQNLNQTLAEEQKQ